MEKQPIVSVIVPVYNAQKFIDRCLKSIIRQTFKDFEIIIINDGSTDNSLEICKSYSLKDDRIRIFSQENGGAASARNAGIAKARGEYIKFIDSDDEITDDCLEKHLCYRYSDIVVSGFIMKWNNKTTKICPDKQILNNKADIINYISGLNIILRGSIWNKLYKKSIIIENNIIFPTSTHNVGEDYIFNWRYFSKCNSFVSVPETYYNYIENPNSLSHFNYNEKPNVDNHLRLMQELLAIKPEIEKINGKFSFSNCHNYFIDMVIRRLYLSNLVSTNERTEQLKIFKDLLSKSGYNPVSASNGILNKSISAAILIPSLKLSDAFISILFKIRRWL